MPVCLKAAGRTNATCEVLSDTSRTIELEGPCASWVFANAGAQGYYRTAYTPDALRALAPHVSAELTAPERLSLIDDEWALVRAGRHSAADYLTLASGYGHETSSGVLKEVSNRLAYIHEYLTADATRPKLEAFLRSLFAPLAAELGFQPSAGDTDDRRALRAGVIAILGTIAGDPGVIAAARSAVDRSLAAGPPIEPTLAGPLIRIAAMHGDAKLFDALAAAATRAGSPEDRYRFLNALGDFRQPALIDRALQQSLSSDMRSQDLALYLDGFFRNPAARARAWSFLVAHWTELEPKLTIVGNDTRIAGAFGRFCDASSRDAVKTFATSHLLPGAARTIDQTMERIEHCSTMRDKETPAVAAWLTAR